MAWARISCPGEPTARNTSRAGCVRTKSTTALNAAGSRQKPIGGSQCAAGAKPNRSTSIGRYTARNPTIAMRSPGRTCRARISTARSLPGHTAGTARPNSVPIHATTRESSTHNAAPSYNARNLG